MASVHDACSCASVSRCETSSAGPACLFALGHEIGHAGLEDRLQSLSETLGIVIEERRKR
jgi:hypothetical protein